MGATTNIRILGGYGTSVLEQLCLTIDLCDGPKFAQPRQRRWPKNLDEFHFVKLHAKGGNRKSRCRTTAMK
jgi:hypothetical protein